MTVPHPAVVRSAASYSEIEIAALQLLCRSATILSEPIIDDFDHPFFEDSGLEDTAVEENGTGVNERFALRDSRLPREECGEVPGNSGILRVRQAQLCQTSPPCRLWKIGHPALRYEAINENTRDI